MFQTVKLSGSGVEYGFFICFIVYLLIFGVMVLLTRRMRDSKSMYLDVDQYIPEDEVHNLRQISYLLLSTILVVDAGYLFFFNVNEYTLAILDVIISMVSAVLIYKRTPGRILTVLCLMPVSSTIFALYALSGTQLFFLTDMLHFVAIIYVAILFVKDFAEYSRSNNLGLYALLLFLIVTLSVFLTSIVEKKNLFDALNMVSNAFTSNGYTVLGSSIIGKFDSIVLVWSGYILSGVGTATLAAAILIKHFRNQFDDLANRFDELNDRFDELEELIENQKED